MVLLLFRANLQTYIYSKPFKERLGGGNKEEGEAKVSWKLGGEVDGLSSFSEIASCSYEARAKGVR